MERRGIWLCRRIQWQQIAHRGRSVLSTLRLPCNNSDWVKCVLRSLVELLQGGASGLSVLRTFRLLRILKVVRFLPALRYQLVVMLRTMDNVATFFALLVLFIFIFRFLHSIFGTSRNNRFDAKLTNLQFCEASWYNRIFFAFSFFRYV